MAMLTAAGSAHGALDGTIVNRAGAPLPEVAVEIRDGRGVAAFGTSDETGRFRLSPGPGRAGPFTLVAADFDECRSVGDPARDSRREIRGVTDGASGLAVILNVLDICQGRPPEGAAAATAATVDPRSRTVVGRPGSRVDVRLRLPFAAADPRLLLADGTRISARSREGFEDLRMTLPATPYGGPLLVAYEAQPTGRTVTRSAGSLLTRGAPRLVTATAGALDTIAIVDLSRSMRANDPGGGRRALVETLGLLAESGERVGAVGFDDRALTIFGLQPVSTSDGRRRLARRASTRIVSRGGSDYNAAFDAAWEAIRTAGSRPRSAKLPILVTDGGHVGAPYRSSHLRFAFADVLSPGATASWPICVIQVGRIAGADEARLRRIARDTGGERIIVGSSDAIAAAALRCRARILGGRTLVSRVVEVAPGSDRRVEFDVAPGSGSLSVLSVSGGAVPGRVALLAPSGVKAPGQRATGALARRLLQVDRPAAGQWALVVGSDRSTRSVVSVVTVPRSGSGP